MKTITIEIPEGKEAKWVDGVLTLVDEQPKAETKFKVGDRVEILKDGTFQADNKNWIDALFEVEGIDYDKTLEIAVNKIIKTQIFVLLT